MPLARRLVPPAFVRELFNRERDVGSPDTEASFHADSMGGHARIGIPAGKSEFDYTGSGEVTWVEDSGGGSRSEVLHDDIISLDDLTNPEPGQTHVLRSLLVYGDDDVTLTVGGSTIKLDPCAFFPIPATEFNKITIDATRPTDVYQIVSTKSNAFSDLGVVNLHIDRSGGFSGVPANNDWVDVAMTVGDFTDANGVATDTDKTTTKVHLQNTVARTCVVRNVGDNNIDIRVLGGAGHAGTFDWVLIDPTNMPFTGVTADGNQIIQTANEAWHLWRIQVTNSTNDESIDVEVDFTAVAP